MSARKIDASQRELVPLIEAHGASFQSTAAVGDGCPDGWVGFLGVDQAVEFKSGAEKKPRVFADGRKRKGTRTELLQAAWHVAWRGRDRVVLRTEADVIAMLNDMRATARGEQP